MIKLVYCLRRLPHLSREEFQRYWLETHGALVRERAQALRIRRYVQVHTLEGWINEALRESRDALEGYDGVAELWWESVEDFATATASPEGRKAGEELLEHERRLIDMERSALWVAKEQAIVEGS